MYRQHASYSDFPTTFRNGPPSDSDIRARMVDDVAAYPWSSYGLRADWLKEPNWLDMDPCFIELGQTAEERYRRYVTFPGRLRGS